MKARVGRLLPRRLRRSYAGKFLATVLAVALAIALVGGTLYYFTGSMLEEETRTEVTSAARIEAQALDEWFEKMELQTKTIAEATAARAGSEAAAVRYLWDVVERDDDLEAAYLVDTANGTVVTNVGSSRIVSASGVMQPSGQRDFTKRASRGEDVVVSRPFRPYEGGAPVILLSASIPDRDGRSLVTVVNLRQFSDSDAHRLDKARFQVIDERGVVVMAENQSEILGDGEPPGQYAGSGFTVTEYDGRKSAVGYTSLDRLNWSVTARMPTEEAFALRSAVLEGVLVVLAVAVLGVGALALVLTRNTVGPIRELAGKARALQRGELDEPIETERVDEFGDLYQSFEEMRVSLAAQIDRARRSRQRAQSARAEAEGARRESEQLRQALERDAKRFGTVMAACAEGDLDRRLEPTSDSDAMADIATAFNEMMEDVQAQNEQLEAFTSIVSHDLRNPLTVAHGRSKLLAVETDSEHVDPIVDSIERMQTIVEDGLMLARGASVEDPQDVHLETHARRAWNHVEGERATLEVADEDARVRSDPDLLEQAFENLFRNAVEHAGPAVTVTVGTRSDGFYVADDGPGLPEEGPADVFDPGVSDGSGGSGLGLTIVKRIADAHGWDVIAGDGAEGARFTFETGTPLPVAGRGAARGDVEEVDST